ncbi:hypothetical protein Cs7R123_31660 [Catellatospora sp. TT07R-123]|uniref:hypothetical protein n=1 Tax=Catellatospora sp. TT07R-123 TaxID=2733863 RepID=UPI001B2C5F37|nr:hypothetical protein [Catellatospora sp. TT07R-123]GHJ45824.1 hypothetical protein Cs7R123_31660 [Catellatospora sp. TT07R-123]
MSQHNEHVIRTPMKILISLAFFSITFLVTFLLDEWKDDRQLIASFGASLFVAGVAFMVQFLYDVERRLARLEVELVASFRRISQATDLFGAVEASQLNTEKITELVARATQIKRLPELVNDLAAAEIDRLSEMFKTFSESGDVTYDGEDRDWLLGLTKHARRSLDAISTTIDGGSQDYLDGSLWQSDLGQRYLEAQREAAIRRNVKIRRIFILDRPTQTDDEKFQRTVRMHQDLRIEVRTLDVSAQSPNFIPPIADVIIFDRVVCYQSSPSAPLLEHSRVSIANTHLVTNRQKVERNIERFNELWELASPLT